MKRCVALPATPKTVNQGPLNVQQNRSRKKHEVMLWLWSYTSWSFCIIFKGDTSIATGLNIFLSRILGSKWKIMLFLYPTGNLTMSSSYWRSINATKRQLDSPLIEVFHGNHAQYHSISHLFTYVKLLGMIPSAQMGNKIDPKRCIKLYQVFDGYCVN